MNKKALLLGILAILVIAIASLSWGQHNYLGAEWIDTSIAAPVKYYRSQDFSGGLIYGLNESEHDLQPLVVYSNR